jgi:hypothetical protein
MILDAAWRSRLKNALSNWARKIVSDNIYALGEKDFTPLLTK